VGLKVFLAVFVKYADTFLVGAQFNAPGVGITATADLPAVIVFDNSAIISYNKKSVKLF